VSLNDHRNTISAPSAEPIVMRARAPRRSTRCPSGSATTPESSSATEKAPEVWVRLQPSSLSIGSRNTEKA
jgi:hypothetical protein